MAQRQRKGLKSKTTKPKRREVLSKNLSSLRMTEWKVKASNSIGRTLKELTTQTTELSDLQVCIILHFIIFTGPDVECSLIVVVNNELSTDW